MQRGLREVIGLVVTYTIPHIRIAVAIAAILHIKEVIDRKAQTNTLRGSGFERIAQIEIRNRIGIERQRLNFVVGEVLLADLLRVP